MGSSVKAVCTLPVGTVIEPGYCVNIIEDYCVGSNDALAGNTTMMINPPIPGAIAECFCENNWSDYKDGECELNTITEFVPTVIDETYEADCPLGTSVQWGLLTYNTDIPDDPAASVVFQVHTAESGATPGAPLTRVATATFAGTVGGDPMPPVCELSACWVDIYDALLANVGVGGFTSELDALIAATSPVLELLITLNPTAANDDGPSINGWEITYSCVEDE
ncbi:MAG: hypothetical protein WC718_18840 [Phycisphaerales bacterium]